MILTCHACPSQIAFAGKNRRLYAKLFGWAFKGSRFYCAWCA